MKSDSNTESDRRIPLGAGAIIGPQFSPIYESFNSSKNMQLPQSLSYQNS